MNDDVKTETFQRRALWPVVKALEAVSSDTPYTWAGWDQERYSYSLLATDTTMMLLCRDLLPEAAGAAKSLISLFQRQGMRKPFWEGGPAGVYVPAAKLRQALTACAKKPKDIMQVSVSRDEPAHATLQVVCSPPDSVGSESEVRWDYEATAYRQLTIDRVIASGIGRHRLPYELPDAADLLDLVALGLTPEGAVSLTHPRPSDSQYDYQRMSRGLSVMHKCKELSVVPGSGVSPQRPLMLTGRHPQLGVAEFLHPALLCQTTEGVMTSALVAAALRLLRLISDRCDRRDDTEGLLRSLQAAHLLRLGFPDTAKKEGSQ